MAKSKEKINENSFEEYLKKLDTKFDKTIKMLPTFVKRNREIIGFLVLLWYAHHC